jgi:AcrR family transcriptional regulator
VSGSPATSDRSPRASAGSAVRGPGRPRSAQADTAIIRATLDLLVADGYRALTMEKVRERAGVGKATIYRRYASKEELVQAAVSHLNIGMPEPPDTGTLRGDFAEIVRALLTGAKVSGALTFMPRMLSEAAHDAELRAIFYAALVQPRRDVVEAILRRAIERGEIRADVDPDLGVDLLAGPMVYRVLITGGDVEQIGGRAMRLFEMVFDGLRAR